MAIAVSRRVAWPNDARCAALVSFDFDAETLWLSRDLANAEKLVTMSFGTFGAKVGVPAILTMLADEAVPATFFVPGWTAERHIDKVEAILRGGHEIGHHGYLHLWPDPEKPEEAEDEIMRGLDALQRTVGVRPVGYRAPAGEASRRLMTLLARERFLYSSSFKDDVYPYRHDAERGAPGLIELPEDPAIDDTVYGFTHLRSPKPLFPEEHVLALWQQSFLAMHEAGGLFNLVLHPQVTGRPMRLALLRKFIAWMREFPGVWFATGEDIARAFAAQEASHDRIARVVGATRFPFAGQIDWPADYVTHVNAGAPVRGIPSTWGTHWPDICVVDGEDRVREVGEVELDPGPHCLAEWQFGSAAADDHTDSGVRHFFVYVPAGREAEAMALLDGASISYAGVRGFRPLEDGSVEVLPFVTTGEAKDDQPTRAR